MRRLHGFLLVWMLAGCGSSGVVHTALHGDLAQLKRDLKTEQAQGKLDRDRVEDLARAVASRELSSATGDDAVRTVRSLRACAAPLSTVLEKRADGSDDVAAEATLILLELGKRDGRALLAKHQKASSGAWRAVAARAATRAADGPLRRQLMADPDQRVRRAALSAALEAAQHDDVDALLEAARLDPDALSRSLALRAAGAIGGERVGLALDDFWARADDDTRVTIVEAWEMSATYRSGGEQKLIRIAETERGAAAISAAAALSRQGGTAGDLGNAVLVRAAKEGSTLERRLALRLAPTSDADVLAALRDAAKSDDADVKVMALARLSAETAERSAARSGLRELAKRDDDVGLQARAALAAAGDASVEKQLILGLSAPSGHARSVAALGLWRLGRYSPAASALADDDPAVRAGVACSILSAEIRASH